MQVTGNVQYYEKTYLAAPNDMGARMYSDYSNGGHWTDSLLARVFALAQAIVSFVVVPFLLLAEISIPIITLFTHNKITAHLYAGAIAGLVGSHLFPIPECLIAIIVPSILTKPIQAEDLMQLGMQGMQLGMVQQQ